MPVYEVDCPYCGIQEIISQKYQSLLMAPCPVCGREAPRAWQSVGIPHTFTPYTTEALSLEPIKVETKKQEKELEKKYHVYRDS